MGTLILVGLLAVAILAIVGLVFVLRSEQPAARTRPDVAAITAPANREAAESPHVHEQQEELHAIPAATTETEQPVEGVETLVSHDNEMHLMLNGQFYELSAQLRTLYQQAQDIELRLGTLVGMIEQIQRSDAEHVETR